MIDAASREVDRVSGQTMAFEHDGLYVKAPCSAEVLQQCISSATGYRITVKMCSDFSMRALLQAIKDRAPIEGWDAIDTKWMEHEALVREAVVDCSLANQRSIQITRKRNQLCLV